MIYELWKIKLSIICIHYLAQVAVKISITGFVIAIILWPKISAKVGTRAIPERPRMQHMIHSVLLSIHTE